MQGGLELRQSGGPDVQHLKQDIRRQVEDLKGMLQVQDTRWKRPRHEDHEETSQMGMHRQHLISLMPREGHHRSMQLVLCGTRVWSPTGLFRCLEEVSTRSSINTVHRRSEPSLD